MGEMTFREENECERLPTKEVSCLHEKGTWDYMYEVAFYATELTLLASLGQYPQVVQVKVLPLETCQSTSQVCPFKSKENK